MERVLPNSSSITYGENDGSGEIEESRKAGERPRWACPEAASVPTGAAREIGRQGSDR